MTKMLVMADVVLAATSAALVIQAIDGNRPIATLGAVGMVALILLAVSDDGLWALRYAAAGELVVVVLATGAPVLFMAPIYVATLCAGLGRLTR